MVVYFSYYEIMNLSIDQQKVLIERRQLPVRVSVSTTAN